jgi:alpha-1,2-mannosyltransferase
MAFLVIILSLLVATVVSVVFLPKTLHLLAELVGRRLRHSSRTRRELLLDRVAAETKAFEAEGKTKSTEDDDWEKIVPSPKGSPSNRGRADTEWNGVVGFFHPFWYNSKFDDLGTLLTEL